MAELQDFYKASSFIEPFQKQPPKVFCKKYILKNLTKFHWKTSALEMVLNFI